MLLIIINCSDDVSIFFKSLYFLEICTEIIADEIICLECASE